MITANEIFHRARQKILLTGSKLFGRKRFTSTVFLAGSGRSGTTWIGNIINHNNDYRVCFEPFHPEKVPEFSSFKNRQYLRGSASANDFLDPLNLLLQGKINNKWINSRNKNPFAGKLLIKDIRANLLLHWIKTHHPYIRIILLLRHPCAVALSRIKLKWGGSVSQFLNQPELVQDYLQPFYEIMKEAEGDLEKCVIAWCIENFVPLRQFAPGEILVCYYENFVLDPEAEVGKMMDFIRDPFPADLETILSLSSDTNWNRSEHSERQELSFNRWKNEISPGDYKKVKHILEKFGMDQFYDDDGHPLSPELKG
jgi:hypothetical protein